VHAGVQPDAEQVVVDTRLPQSQAGTAVHELAICRQEVFSLMRVVVGDDVGALRDREALGEIELVANVKIVLVLAQPLF